MPYDPNTGQYYDAGTGYGTQPQQPRAASSQNPYGYAYPNPYSSNGGWYNYGAAGVPTGQNPAQSDAMYAPGYGPNGSTSGSSGAAPTYDRSNPAPYVNYYYNKQYGTDAPPDQMQYWSGKLASNETMGNGQVATPDYWMMRLQNPNYDTGNGSGGGNYLNYQSAPLFQAGSPFQGSNVPQLGSFQYQGLQTPNNFQLPTGQQALDQDPGYQFRIQQGVDALQNSAAARGGLRDPNTARAIQDYGQQEASGEYQNAYNRALQTYQTNTGTNLQAQNQQYQQGLQQYQTNSQTALAAQAQDFNQQLQQYQTNFSDPLAAYQANTQAQLGFGSLGLQQQLGMGNLGVSQGYLGLAGDQQGYSQLYGLANLGLNAAGGNASTNLGYTNGLENLYGNNANAMGNYMTGAGNAQAAGQVGSANAWNAGLGNIGNLGSNLGALAALRGMNRPAPPNTNSGGW